MSLEQHKEYLLRAKKKLEEQKKKSEELDNAYYKKITSGNSWKFFTFTSFFCLLIAIIATIDSFVDGKTSPLPQSAYQYERVINIAINPVVWVGEDIFTPYHKHFVSVDYDSFTITRSLIFNKAKYISFDAHTLDDRERFKAYERFSMFEWFPFLQIMLLIPFLVFLFKRQTAFFKFMRYLSLLLIFPASIIISFYQLI